jgi:hypothetical protein
MVVVDTAALAVQDIAVVMAVVQGRVVVVTAVVVVVVVVVQEVVDVTEAQPGLAKGVPWPHTPIQAAGASALEARGLLPLLLGASCTLPICPTTPQSPT